MSDRAALITAFLTDAGWAKARRTLLAGDASNRRYDRVSHPSGRGAVLMDAPPDKGEDVRPFVAISETLTDMGLSAPEIYHAQQENGFLLIEDLGDDLFARICAHDPSRESEIYAAAIDVLVEISRHKPPATLLPYSDSDYLREALLMPQWYLPVVSGTEPSETLVREYSALITRACHLLPASPSVVVLRDYHAENLIWLPERRGVNRVGLLDYQDALAGHPAYDVVSLLEDARRDTSDALQDAMKARYLAASGYDETDFLTAYSILGAQRNLKIVGIFARLCLRDGKPGYIDLIPRVWAHLQRDLSHPALAELRDWIAQVIPEPDPGKLLRIKENCG